MENAVKDSNSVASIIGVLNTDGKTTKRIYANPTTHVLQTSVGATGSNLGPTNALTDANSVSTLMVVSSADGVTPIALYVDSSHNLLIN